LSYHRDNLLQVVCGRLQQLFTVAAPTLAVADVRAETNDMKPQSNTVRVPARERQIKITVNNATTSSSYTLNLFYEYNLMLMFI